MEKLIINVAPTKKAVTKDSVSLYPYEKQILRDLSAKTKMTEKDLVSMFIRFAVRYVEIRNDDRKY